MKTFWTHPNATRYERLVRENVQHVGKQEGFCAIAQFLSFHVAGYTTLQHDNIDVLFNVKDDYFVIIEWPKHSNLDGMVDNEIRQVYSLSDYPLVKELAVYLENKHK